GLGRGLGETGRLNPEGVQSAMRALFRFKAITRAQHVEDVTAFATAAVREAEDGAAFCARVREETGLALRVLSGEDEARYAGYGVLAIRPDADGIAGDLGGSSLELSGLSGGYYVGGRTYPLGPLALETLGEPGSEALARAIRSALTGAPELSIGARTFFAVGGAWRALARLEMERRDYPLRILQNYEIDADRVHRLVERVLDPDERTARLIDNLARRRASTLPYAAVVLREIMRIGRFERLSVSSFGAREGLVFEGLDEASRAKDPLIAGVEVLMSSDPDAAAFGRALANWLRQPAADTLEPRLVDAACRLADVGGKFHTDHRADMAFDLVARAPIAGVSHRDRLALALAVGSRYSRGFRDRAAEALLDGDTAARARTLGALMRLAADFSGRSAQLLGFAELTFDGGVLELRVDGDYRDLASEMVEKRLQQIAAIQGCEVKLALG
ncbi:MAG: Ppx/GppA family phosphatase, partial [Pseudomonadota bacterium]